MTNALLKHGPVVEAAIRNTFEMRISNRNTDDGLLNLTEVLASLSNQRVIPVPFGYAYEGGSPEKLAELQCKLRDEGKWEFNLLQGLSEGRYRVVGKDEDEHYEPPESTPPVPQPTLPLTPDDLSTQAREFLGLFEALPAALRGPFIRMGLRLMSGFSDARVNELAEQEIAAVRDAA